MDYFFDNQLRRYILQFIRIFSDIKIETDPDENGVRVQKRIPIKYGDMSRMVAHILSQQSQNTVLSAPSMAVTISKIEMNSARRQDPTFVGLMQGVERKYDKDNNVYLDEPGNRFTVERYMPVPYDLTMKLDIWTTNQNTKTQILEQIMTLFNPSVQLEHIDNPFDWSSIMEVELIDTNWTNKSIPVGADSTNEFATFTFKIPIWINPPSKVKRQALIKNIVTRVTSVDNLSDAEISRAAFDMTSFGEELTQICITSGDYKIKVGYNGTLDEIQLVNKYGVPEDGLTWESISVKYGYIVPGVTKMVLKTDSNIESDDGDIYGLVSVKPNDPSKLIFVVDVDTLPPTISYSPITAIVDPTIVRPGNGLPTALYGQLYLIRSSYSDNREVALDNTPGWGTVVAHENDIIKYDGSDWVVVFDSTEQSQNQYIKNLADGQHYKFNGEYWVYTFLGQYNPGYWRLENLNTQ